MNKILPAFNQTITCSSIDITYPTTNTKMDDLQNE
jgi:hypothetical protein